MKIVHVCLNSSVFSENYSYQENLLTKAYRKMGHDVSIITHPYLEYDKKTSKIISAPTGTKIIGDGIKLIRLRPVLPCRINQHIHIFWGLRKSLEDQKPDLIFVHGVVPINYRIFKEYKRKHPNVQIVYDNHGDFNNSCHNKLSYLYLRYVVRNLVVRNILNTSDFFYGVTPARCDFLYDVYGIPKNKIHLLPMGADEDDMQIEKKDQIREDVRRQYNIRPDDFLIVTGGKIDPLKNIHILAEAVKQSELKEIKMIIFGSIRDDLRGIFDRLLSDRIQYVGWIPSNEVYRYFYAADLVMFPGLHSVLWEQAVASQVPCAFSRIPGFEHVDIGGNCVLMEGKTIDYYLPLIEKIYLDKIFYEKLYKSAHSEESKQFLYKRIAQQVINDTSM